MGVVALGWIHPGWACDFGSHLAEGVVVESLPKGLGLLNRVPGFDLFEDFKHNGLYLRVLPEEQVTVL